MDWRTRKTTIHRAQGCTEKAGAPPTRPNDPQKRPEPPKAGRPKTDPKRPQKRPPGPKTHKKATDPATSDPRPPTQKPAPPPTEPEGPPKGTSRGTIPRAAPPRASQGERRGRGPPQLATLRVQEGGRRPATGELRRIAAPPSGPHGSSASAAAHDATAVVEDQEARATDLADRLGVRWTPPPNPGGKESGPPRALTSPSSRPPPPPHPVVPS